MEQEVSIGEERKEEGISEGSDEQEFEAGLPGKQAWRVKGHLRFGEAERHFNLPASGIGKNNILGLFRGVNGFRVEETHFNRQK